MKKIKNLKLFTLISGFLFNAAVWAGKSVDQFEVGGNQIKVGKASGFESIMESIISMILGFLPWLQITVVIIAVILFVISIVNLFRGQQMDFSEVLKNLLIYGLVAAAGFFGPQFLIGLFSQQTAAATIASSMIM